MPIDMPQSHATLILNVRVNGLGFCSGRAGKESLLTCLNEFRRTQVSLCLLICHNSIRSFLKNVLKAWKQWSQDC